MYKESVIKYFADKAAEYDLVEHQSYWRLSDALLWDSIQTYVIPKLSKDFNFCDAGGGTGRWSLKLLENYADCSGTTIDFSPEMLAVAEQKADKDNLRSRWKFIQQDLQNLSGVTDKYDLIISFHNVIGFVEDTDKMFAELKNILKKDGIFCCLVPNMYHAAFFNTKLGNIEEANKCLSGRGRFTSQMPYINMFSPNTIKEMFEKHGMEVVLCSGFPNMLYPGYQETQLHGQTKGLSDMLEDKDIFDKIFNMEKENIGNSDIAGRGNNIFIIAKNK